MDTWVITIMKNIFGKKEKVKCWYYQLTHKSKKQKSTVNRTLYSPCN